MTRVNTSPSTQKQFYNFLPTPFPRTQMGSMLIPNISQQCVQETGGRTLPDGGSRCLNMLQVLSGSSAIGICSTENYIPIEFMSQLSFVQQNHELFENAGGATVTPSPVYQICPTQNLGRTTEDQISTLNQDELTTESHPGFANWLHLRAQRTSSVNEKSVLAPPDWLTFGTNSACPGLAQTWHLANSSAQTLQDPDMQLGIPVDNYSRSHSVINGGPLSFRQQQCWVNREQRHSLEEKHEQEEKDQEEKRAPSAATSWRQIQAPTQWREVRNERTPALDKFVKFRFQEECIKLYGFQAPLHYAVKMNDSNRIRQLLKKNNPNGYHMETGETPMHLACRLGKLHIVKLLRRHPEINMNLRTVHGDKSVSPPGITAVHVALHFRKFEVVNFLGFKPNNHWECVELSPLVYELSNEQEIIKQELHRLKPVIEALTKENQELEKKLRKLQIEDVFIMGKKLPRNKPTDNKKLAEVLKVVRELESDLTALQERIWSEREDEKQCIICVERQGDTVLVPCGHFFCSICSRAVDQCPNCRRRIERRIKTFR